MQRLQTHHTPADWHPGCAWLSAWREALLRSSGARSSRDFSIKPGLRVKFPWRLVVGNHYGLAEDAWIDNLASVTIGDCVGSSQGTYLCTGNHNFRSPGADRARQSSRGGGTEAAAPAMKKAVQPPDLLIVVPTLDSHQLLPHLVASLKEQTWPHWQLLFVDGPSGPEHRRWLEQCCADDGRCRWIAQSPDHPGIFGAMNQGFAAAADRPNCWLLFWGSDDWAASATVLAEAMALLEQPSLDQPSSSSTWPDLLICGGRYSDATGHLGRRTSFRSGTAANGAISANRYRWALRMGSTPPHQATLIGPGARHHLNRYADGFRLSADLDYFLQLGRRRDLHVHCLDLELVHMADGGVSGLQTRRRLQEVHRAYRRTYGWLWWFPFLARYCRRLVSSIEAQH